MASGPSEHSSVLQEELTCPVCLDLYNDPHLLPCGHNFCKTCLDRLKRQADRGRFRCPECRDSHRCGTNFQKNFKLANIADDYRQRLRYAGAAAATSKSSELQTSSVAAKHSRGVFAVPCDYCPTAPCAAKDGPSASQDGSDKEETAAAATAAAAAATSATFAVKMCLKCEVSMCQEHLKPHLELPALREHPLTEPMSDFWKRKCPDHDEIYRYYCMDDKVCVCNGCTVEGGHSGHTIKTLKNTMKDLKCTLDKRLYKVERKYSMTEKRLQEQKEKERQNKKFMDDSEQCLTRLSEEMKAKVLCFISRLRECTRTHCQTNGSAIQKNVSRICQDQARLQEVRCGVENLMQETDPFRFIEAYKTTGKQCRRQLRKNLFYPEYIDLDTEALGAMMEEEMRKFVEDDLICHIADTLNSLCQLSGLDEHEEEGVGSDDYDDDDDNDNLNDSSEGEEEEDDDDEEEEEEEEEHDHSELTDDLYSPREEEEEEEEEELEEEEDEDDEDDEEDEEV